jgi:serine/threonine-protein kinase
METAILRRRPAAPAAGRGLILALAIVPFVIGIALVLILKRPAPPAPAPAEPAPTLPAETEPPPEATAPVEIDGVDAAGWTVRLKKAAAVKDWLRGAKAFLALAKLDPEQIKAEEMRDEVISVAAGIAFENNSEEADQVFDVLANRLGSEGLDLLFEIVRSRGATQAGRRASEILSRPEVMAQATPALRVTFEFRRATCGAKRTLLDRAAEEGDQRTLFELQIAQGVRCPRKLDPCCFREDQAMTEAIRKLKARLGR